MAPIYRPLDHNFFKKWSHAMAYVLGYFAADGTMLRNKRGAYFIEFHSTDRCLIEMVRTAMKSGHTIGIRKQKNRNPNWKNAYRLQLGSKEIFKDLSEFGFVQNKSLVVKLPVMPAPFFPDFVRGNFDGDGNVYFKKHWVQARKKKKWVFACRFTSGCKQFLLDLHQALKRHGVQRGFILQKSNKSGYELVLSHRDSLALYGLMYNTASDTGFYLPRKYKLFSKAIRTLYPKMRV